MKQLLKPFFIGLLTGLIGWILWNSRTQKSKTETISTGDTIKIVLHDTLWYQFKGKPNVTDSAFTDLHLKVDTATILKRYFARYAYADTLADSNLVLILTDTITQNRIISRRSSYRIIRPQIIEYITTTINTPPKAAFYAGAFISLGERVGIGAEALFISKTQTIYGLGYDLQNKAFVGRIAWKIK